MFNLIMKKYALYDIHTTKSIVKMPAVAICDPMSANFALPYDKTIAILNVNADVMKLLRSPPAMYEDADSRAFVYGKQRRLKSYEHCGEVIGELGVVAVIEITKEIFPSLLTLNADLRQFVEDNREENGRSVGLYWDKPEIIAKLKTQFPFILFIENTNMGGLATQADVYVHSDMHGVTNGILIDCDYFYGDSSSDSSRD